MNPQLCSAAAAPAPQPPAQATALTGGAGLHPGLGEMLHGKGVCVLGSVQGHNPVLSS